jgi:hypothetical protein
VITASLPALNAGALAADLGEEVCAAASGIGRQPLIVAKLARIRNVVQRGAFTLEFPTRNSHSNYTVLAVGASWKAVLIR